MTTSSSRTGLAFAVFVAVGLNVGRGQASRKALHQQPVATTEETEELPRRYREGWQI
jgi:hypothetical protein